MDPALVHWPNETYIALQDIGFRHDEVTGDGATIEQAAKDVISEMLQHYAQDAEEET